MSTIEKKVERKIIILSLKSDEKKLEFLDAFGESEKEVYKRNLAKTDLIASLVSDEKKLEFLQNPTLDDECKVRIITSLSSDEKKLEFLENFSNPDVKFEILNSVHNLSDEKICDEISKHYKKKNIGALICRLSTDEKKIEMMEKHFSVELEGNSEGLENVRRIICSLSSDEKKLELLDKIPSETSDYRKDFREHYKDEYRRTKINIICSLSSDEKKIALLDILDHEGRCRVIASLASEEKRLEFLEKSEYKKAEEIITTLSSDEKKLELFNSNLGLPGEEANRASGFILQMAESMTSDESLLNMIEYINNDRCKDIDKNRRKSIVSECISDIGLKLEVIKKLEPEYRGRAIERLFEDAMKERKIKVSALHKLENTLELDDPKDDLREYRRKAYEKLRSEFNLDESSSSESSTVSEFNSEELNPEQLAEYDEHISEFEKETREDITISDEER